MYPNIMDSIIDDDLKSWPNNYFQPEELNSCFEDMSVGGYYDSSSPDPDGGQDQSSSSLAASKNIVSERNRRKKLNERLYALRAVVPNITKMDKASIIKDAIEYIEKLNKEERRIQEEISELESGIGAPLLSYPDPYPYPYPYPYHHQSTTTTATATDQHHHFSPIKRSRTMESYTNSCGGGSSSSAPSSSRSSFILPSSTPIELLELRVSSMGVNSKTIVVSLSCSKGADTMVKLCDIFESLNLNIISATITAFSGRLLKTLFIQGDEEEKDVLSFKIRAAIAAINDPYSPTSI